MKITPSDQTILLALQDIKDNKKDNTYSPKQLVNLTGIPYATVATAVRKLNLLGCIYKLSGGDKGGFRYRFKSATPDNEAYRRHIELNKLKIPNLLERTQGTRLEYKDLMSLMGKWSQGKWEPKIFKTARNLPLSLAGVVELVTQMAYGSNVSNEDLNTLIRPIEIFEQDLKATLSVVEGILKDKRFRDPSALYAFFLNNGSIEQLQTLALKVKENN